MLGVLTVSFRSLCYYMHYVVGGFLGVVFCNLVLLGIVGCLSKVEMRGESLIRTFSLILENVPPVNSDF